MRLFTQSLFSGGVNGATYALIGLGLVLYFRSSRVVNLAHGETYMVTGVITSAGVAAGWPLWISASLGVGISVLGMVALDTAVLRPRSALPMSQLIIVTLAAALVVRGAVIGVAGSNPRSFPPMISGDPVRLFGAALSRQGLVTIGVTIGVGVLLAWILKSTIYGQAMSAVAENATASALLGVDVTRVRLISYVAASALGGAAALLVVPLTFVDYRSGLPTVLLGFVAASLANMRSLERVLVGGFALGIVESMIGAYWDPLLRRPIVYGLIFTSVVVWLARGVRFGGAARA